MRLRKLMLWGARALLAACARTSSIQGSVKLEGVEDASGAVVTLEGKDVEQMLQTGSDGAFRFDDLLDGDYRLTVEVSDTAEVRQVMVLRLENGNGLNLDPLNMTALATVHGSVELAGSSSKAGVQVSVAGTGVSADGKTGTLATVSGTFTWPVTYEVTNHGDWLQFSTAAGSYYLQLSTATATAWPTGFTLAEASTATISPAGTQVLFTRTQGIDVGLHLAPMPLTIVPTASAMTTGDFKLGWVTPARAVAFDYGSTRRRLDFKNDTMTESTDFASNERFSRTSVTWKRTDNALMAIHGDSDPFVLDANAANAASVTDIFETRNDSWAGWVVRETPVYTLIVRETATGQQRTFENVYRNDGELAMSDSGMVVFRNFADNRREMLDFTTGLRRPAYEPMLSGNPSLRTTSEGRPYLRTSYYPDPSYNVEVPALATF